MIRIVQGNLFESGVHALVHPVNCKGVMGTGLAREFKHRFPAMFTDYTVKCQAGAIRIGHVSTFREHERLIINFPTREDWREFSRLRWIESGLNSLRQLIQAERITSIAIPALGCGVGGLHWPDVHARIVDALGSLEGVDIEVYPSLGEHAEVNIERLEVIDGELIEKPGASFAHGVAHWRIGAALAEIEGWSLAASIELELEPQAVCLPDIAGWRMARVPEPQGEPVRVRPDWVCEIMSRETAARDLGHKRAVYHRAGIEHYWLVDLEHGIVMVLRWHEGGYVVAQVAGFEAHLRLEPFHEHEIDLSGLTVARGSDGGTP